MANKRKLKDNQKIQKEIKLLVKKPELWIGAFTILLFLGVGFFIVGSKLNLLTKKMKQKANEDKIISPIILTTITPKPNPKIKEENQALKTVVKKLADTKGEINYTVVAGDSYWQITKKICGTGNNFQTVSEDNNNQDLQPGKIIKIKCE
jgi:hypothetical protein